LAKLAGILVGLSFVAVGVILFAIGASGTVSYIQIGIGLFLALVGALAILGAIK